MQIYLSCNYLPRYILNTYIRYLGCTEVGSLAKEEQAGHAFHLALAALLGDRIFNFGQCKRKYDMVGGDMARVTSLGNGPMDSVQVGKAVFVKEKLHNPKKLKYGKPRLGVSTLT